MTPTRYLNHRLQTLAKESAMSGGSYRLVAEADAVQFIFNAFRWGIAAFFIPKVILDYLLVSFRLKRAPTPELDLLRAQNQAEKDARTKSLRKKVGFNGTH